jgi:alcohol dehydrogenase class IV
MSGRLRLNFPGVSHVGPGCIEVLGEEASGLGSRALLVTGRTALRRAGITDRLGDLLRNAEIEVVLFERVPPEPDVGTVDAARERIGESRCDLVVEAGGGSAMDVGKVAAALAHEDGPTAEFHGGRTITRPGLPHVAIATTAGTGAEVTRNGVITNPETKLKKSIRGDGVMPTVSITDPELTLSCPPDVTAAAGMDALVQAIESFFSVKAIPTTEALSLRAAELIALNLSPAFENGQNLPARAAVSEGSYMAGLALGSARLGAVHGLAHPVGLCYGRPHGVVCAALTPPVLERNREAEPAKYEALREAMGGDPVALLRAMNEGFGLPRTLGPPRSAEWEQIILDYALGSGSSAANPVPVDAQFVREILEEVSE